MTPPRDEPADDGAFAPPDPETLDGGATGDEAADQADGAAEAKEWWDDPALPWRHKPTRTDLACWLSLSLVGLFGLALLPLRPLLIANPSVGAVVTGGRTSMVMLGAFLRVDGGPTVLVNRGYVSPVQGTRVPEIAAPPTGSVTITARLRDPELVVTGKDPFRADGAQQVYSINPGQIAEVTEVPLTGSYLQLVDDQPGGLGVIDPPHLDGGPFLSYGIQWIAFGIIAPLGVGYFVVAEVRQRRRERSQSVSRTTTSAVVSPEDKLADRYGRRQ